MFQAVDFCFRPLKAFINERKHQKQPRKAVKQKKTHQVLPRSHSTEKAHDYHPIEEFSFQSSSFDIAGPETPSPPSESDTSVLQDDNRSETNMSQVEMDPHVARLLGSLALSAAASESFTNEKSTKAAGDEAKSIVSSHATNSDDSPFVSHAHGVHQYKGSSPLPSQVSQVSQQTGVSSRAHNHDHSASPHLHKTFSTLNVRPEPSSNGITLIEENLSPLSNDRTAHASILTPPSQPRRATSTADILPYLTRAADDVPISATRLKQLSLLETVADESARMSSVIAARAAMASNPAVNSYPLLPQSVPPQSMMLGNTRDPGLIYSSDHPRAPSHALGFQPVYNPLEHNFHGEHDASQFRSRTSQSTHRTLTHNPTGSINIHQSHLLAALNGSRTPSLNPSQYGPSTHNVSMYPRHIPPSQMFHSARQPSPTVTGFTSINRGLHPATVYPPYNPSLLSILNTRSSQPPTVPAQFHQ